MALSLIAFCKVIGQKARPDQWAKTNHFARLAKMQRGDFQGELPWQSVRESNPSFQVENLTS
jgi:hypothetical protein